MVAKDRDRRVVFADISRSKYLLGTNWNSSAQPVPHHHRPPWKQEHQKDDRQPEFTSCSPYSALPLTLRSSSPCVYPEVDDLKRELERIALMCRNSQNADRSSTIPWSSGPTPIPTAIFVSSRDSYDDDLD